ncbi:hypothetical protein PROFUN_09457 [Planoprotostelium fungivorum]|uniref:Uncharacterized protein n=1 Tax=Planoprotostelium fungivorum TaxID=1890364 RepID=A0A2P6NH18_9EUKA|nr:hypothetical protein PROFUN_09457 [Planoprotostelium fungivorum]
MSGKKTKPLQSHPNLQILQTQGKDVLVGVAEHQLSTLAGPATAHLQLDTFGRIMVIVGVISLCLTEAEATIFYLYKACSEHTKAYKCFAENLQTDHRKQAFSNHSFMVGVLLTAPNGRTSTVQVVLSKQGLVSLHNIKTSVEEHLGIPYREQRITSYGNLPLNDWLRLEECAILRVQLRLLGGKGGFGALLRGAGSKGKKTTNFDDCRDLDGRRVRHVKNEERLAEWNKEQELLRAEEEKKKKNREPMKQLSTFDNTQYREEIEEIDKEVEDAVRTAIKRRRANENKKESVAEKKKKPIGRFGWGADVSSSDDSEEEERESSDKEDSTDVLNGEEEEEILVTTTTTRKVTILAGSTQEATTLAHQLLEQIHQNDQKEMKENDQKETKENERGKEENVEYKDNGKEAEKGEALEEKAEVVEKREQEEGINLDKIETAAELESIGMEGLKKELMRRGLIVGGTLSQRAQRLFSVKGKRMCDIDQKILAKVNVDSVYNSHKAGMEGELTVDLPVEQERSCDGTRWTREGADCRLTGGAGEELRWDLLGRNNEGEPAVDLKVEPERSCDGTRPQIAQSGRGKILRARFSYVASPSFSPRP